ncbi:hypothetical protein TWF694_007283 [Orbilia ellipsospora]|uniref:Prion-inhibition and propagation HeLo domain-containing protein n=1 Tax=Orbilia ellipsospora TaxID=2528407 RepID=A0AAV9XHS9_9PEZI
MSTSIDPVGALGTGIGAASFFIQLIQGCVAGFSLWQQAEAVGSEALIFEVRLNNQAAKLKAWAQQWGVEEGQYGRYFTDLKFNEYGTQAVNSVLMVSSLLDALKDMNDELPILHKAAVQSNIAGSSLENLSKVREPQPWNFVSNLDEWERKMRDLRGAANLNERLAWALENGKASDTLENIERLINDIYVLLPPPNPDPALTVLLNKTLPSNNIALLNTVPQQIPNNPLLCGLALIRSATLQLELRNNILSKININKNQRDFKPVKLEEKNNREFGTFRGDDVLSEWKMVDSRKAETIGLGSIFRGYMEVRIKNGARLLMSDGKPEELRTLPCLGMITRSGKSDSETLYGLLYKTPSKICFSLLELLKNSTDKFWLDDRYSSALIISKAILYLHLAGWLHKGIRGGNILFFQDPGTNGIDYAKPYLVGFDYSRENAPNAQTEDVIDDLEWNLYRHPDVQGVPVEKGKSDAEGESVITPKKGGRIPFSAIYDIYSFGVVLLEIALMEPVWDMYQRAIRDPNYQSHSASAFRLWLLDHIVPQLGPRAGKAYYEAAKSCLDGSLLVDSDKSLSESFYLQVIQKLERHTS